MRHVFNHTDSYTVGGKNVSQFGVRNERAPAHGDFGLITRSSTESNTAAKRAHERAALGTSSCGMVRIP